jgi:Calcineurin-like phosphoesterase
LLTALLSDVHGNLEALNGAWDTQLERGTERFAFLGDFVGYGADACGVVDTVAGYAAGSAVVIKGNHDEAIEQRGGYFNEASRGSLEWARETLSDDQKAFLAALPLIDCGRTLRADSMSGGGTREVFRRSIYRDHAVHELQRVARYQRQDVRLQ